MSIQCRAVYSICILGALLVSVLLAVPAIAGEPLDRLRATINEVIAIVTDGQLEQNEARRRSRLREVIGERFSYRQMGARTLQDNWKDLSGGQQQEFISLFKKLLEKAYGNMIENYNGGSILYLDEQVRGRFALVRTEVKRTDRTVHLDYKMVQEQGEWRVFDLAVDEVSLTHNYQRQFTKVLEEESISALLDRMKKSVT